MDINHNDHISFISPNLFEDQNESLFKQWLSNNDIYISIDEHGRRVSFTKQIDPKSEITCTYNLDRMAIVVGFEDNFYNNIKEELSRILLSSSNNVENVDIYGFIFELEPYCQGCSEYCPRAIYSYSDDEVFSTRIICDHKNKCKNIYKRMQEGLGDKAYD